MDVNSWWYSAFKHPLPYLVILVMDVVGFVGFFGHPKAVEFGIAFIMSFWVIAMMIRENENKKRAGLVPVLGWNFYKIVAIPVALFLLNMILMFFVLLAS